MSQHLEEAESLVPLRSATVYIYITLKYLDSQTRLEFLITVLKNSGKYANIIYRCGQTCTYTYAQTCTHIHIHTEKHRRT